ncbi:MAG: creatininase family protein [Victivallaceae bacterium]|jgi:creatinine amidohydrolase
MRYELMFPEQIRKAIDENWPVVLSLGVLEYHAEHCCVGVDTLLVARAVEELEKEIKMVILPPFYYGAASFAVDSPERKGTIHVKSEVLNLFGRELFSSLLRIGFRNVYGIYYHQSENFIQGMPTDLSFKLAARQAIFEFLEKEHGEGWWGREDSADYYEKHHGKGENPFNWIQIHPLKHPSCQGDHAGLTETSLMMAFCPEGVDMAKERKLWYAKSADGANVEYGMQVKADVMRELRKTLSGKNND